MCRACVLPGPLEPSRPRNPPVPSQSSTLNAKGNTATPCWRLRRYHTTAHGCPISDHAMIQKQRATPCTLDESAGSNVLRRDSCGAVSQDPPCARAESVGGRSVKTDLQELRGDCRCRSGSVGSSFNAPHLCMGTQPVSPGPTRVHENRANLSSTRNGCLQDRTQAGRGLHERTRVHEGVWWRSEAPRAMSQSQDDRELCSYHVGEVRGPSRISFLLYRSFLFF